MNADQETHCYALLRLNPFLGVLQVVETPAGRLLAWFDRQLGDRGAAGGP